MAVFPDRIVLKNSTDTEADILAAIGTGGTDAITQGEVVIGLQGPSVAKFYTKTANGSIVSLGGTGQGADYLYELGDVFLDESNLVDGYVLRYNATSQLWEPALNETVLPDTNLDDLSDVSIPQTPNDLQVLTYSLAEGQWTAQDTQSFYTDPMRDLGDMVYHNGTEARRLPPGVDGQVLGMSQGYPTWETLAGTGTVTSVGITSTGGLEVSDSPVTVSGDIKVGLERTGVSAGAWSSPNITIDQYGRILQATPFDRVLDDLADVSGSPENGQFLAYNSTSGDWEPKSAGGNGTVTEVNIASSYPISVTDSPITAAGTIRIGMTDAGPGAGAYPFPSSITLDAKGRVVALTPGGTPLFDPTVDEGDILLRFGNEINRLEIGEEGQQLTVVDGYPNWQTISSGGTVTEVAIVSGTGIDVEGDPVTETGSFVISLTDTSVQAGTYFNPTLTVDPQGRIISAVNGSGGGGGGLEEVADDTSPALGGNLDLRGYYLIDNGSVTLGPGNGKAVIRGGGGSDASLTLNCSANSHGVTLKAPPHSQAATYTLTLPSTAGDAGQVLSTNGTQLEWIAAGGGGASVLDDLDDVDTTTSAPTPGQALVWNPGTTQWVPGNVATTSGVTKIYAGANVTISPSEGTGEVTINANVTGGGGSGGSGAGIYLQETQYSLGGEATYTNLGYSGILQKVASDTSAWVVMYTTAEKRTEDSTRLFNEDPGPGNGVLFEALVPAGGTIVATPGTTYLNGDTALTEAIYVAVRDTQGFAVEANVTFSAYGLAAITAVSGGEFGSGL